MASLKGTDYIILALMLIIYTFTSFAAPMGINRILKSAAVLPHLDYL
jgi:hypothetical protein